MSCLDIVFKQLRFTKCPAFLTLFVLLQKLGDGGRCTYCVVFNANSSNSLVLIDAHCYQYRRQTLIWTQYLDPDDIQNILLTSLFKEA